MSDNRTIFNAQFITNRPTIVLIHGYTGHKDFEPNQSIRPAYFKNDDYNIISLDFNPLVRAPCYLQAFMNLRVVANCTAQMLEYIVENAGIKFDSIHVIGFSVGAHVAGQIKNYLKDGKMLKRITGLDPAQPGFVGLPNRWVLDADDAEFVDVIHTDIIMRGLFYAIGHVDFYANSGYGQPGCSEIDALSPSFIYSCSHDRAPMYYAESINSEIGFWGSTCPSLFRYFEMCSATLDNMELFGRNASFR